MSALRDTAPSVYLQGCPMNGEIEEIADVVFIDQSRRVVPWPEHRIRSLETDIALHRELLGGELMESKSLASVNCCVLIFARVEA